MNVCKARYLFTRTSVPFQPVPVTSVQAGTVDNVNRPGPNTCSGKLLQRRVLNSFFNTFFLETLFNCSLWRFQRFQVSLLCCGVAEQVWYISSMIYHVFDFHWKHHQYIKTKSLTFVNPCKTKLFECLIIECLLKFFVVKYANRRRCWRRLHNLHKFVPIIS